VVLPAGYIPLLRGDSLAGRVSIDLSLAEMPRPLLNAVMVNVQAWFVPKAAHPQFSGMDEFLASYAKENIPALGAVDRAPPAFFISSVNAPWEASEFAKTLGIHFKEANVNSDILDAFNLIYNFRLAAHSSKLTRKPYVSENWANAVALPPAFWPASRFSRVVPDYERALVVGALDLDVSAGQLPVHNLVRVSGTGTNVGTVSTAIDLADGSIITPTPNIGNLRNVMGVYDDSGTVWAEMAGQTVTTSLADIDKARTTQAFAKLRTSMAGMNTSGFINEDTVLAHLMQGLSVPVDQFKRPWLLDAKRVPFGFAERFATDSAALDVSVTTGRATAQLSLNVPSNDVGGMVIFTIEVLPEQIFERQGDYFLHVTDPDYLPNALRDIQNPEPVDNVNNFRIDAKHTTPDGLYGYEPMNDKWNRAFTRLGGVFYQDVPGTPQTEQRSAIWQADVVDPALTENHWLAPAPFPHYVFADTAAPAFEFVVRHSTKIVGLTQIGDVLVENNDDYQAVKDEGAIP